MPDSPVMIPVAIWDELFAVAPSHPEHAGDYPATDLCFFVEV